MDNSAPDVMIVQASLIDLRNADLGDVPDMRAGLDDVARPGVLVFTMELRDSATDRVLARAADSKSSPKIGTGENSSTDWADVSQGS